MHSGEGIKIIVICWLKHFAAETNEQFGLEFLGIRTFNMVDYLGHGRLPWSWEIM